MRAPRGEAMIRRTVDIPRTALNKIKLVADVRRCSVNYLLTQICVYFAAAAEGSEDGSMLLPADAYGGVAQPGSIQYDEQVRKLTGALLGRELPLSAVPPVVDEEADMLRARRVNRGMQRIDPRKAPPPLSEPETTPSRGEVWPGCTPVGGPSKRAKAAEIARNVIARPAVTVLDPPTPERVKPPDLNAKRRLREVLQEQW